MSDLKAELHRVEFPLRLRPRPHWGAYSAPETTYLYLRGRSSKEREGEREGREEKVRGEGGKT